MTAFAPTSPQCDAFVGVYAIASSRLSCRFLRTLGVAPAHALRHTHCASVTYLPLLPRTHLWPVLSFSVPFFFFCRLPRKRDALAFFRFEAERVSGSSTSVSMRVCNACICRSFVVNLELSFDKRYLAGRYIGFGCIVWKSRERQWLCGLRWPQAKVQGNALTLQIMNVYLSLECCDGGILS